MTDLSSIFSDVLSDLYDPATLVTVTLVPDGQGGGSTTETSRSVRVQEDRITEETRQAGGYTQQAKRFIILQDGGVLTGDSRLTVAGRTYALNTPEQDPVKAYWFVIGVPV